MLEAPLNERYASRKFALTLLAFVIGLIGWIVDALTAAQWTEYTKWVLGLYMAGNVGASAATGFMRSSQT